MNPLKSLGRSYAILLFTVFISLTACKKNQDDSNSSTNETITLLSPPFYNASVSSSYIVPVDLFVDSKENKWIVCGDPIGAWILKYDGTTWEKFTSSNISTPLQFHIAVHTEDNEGSIYFTTYDTNEYYRYLIRYKSGVWTHWNITNAVEADKTFFNPSDNNLYFYSDDEVKKAALSSNFALSSSYSTVTSSAIPYSTNMDGVFTAGNFYITGENKSIKVSANGTVTNLTPVENTFRFRGLYAGSNGSIYATVSSSSDRIYRLNGTTWNLVPYTNGNYANTFISQLTVDKSENIFVNTFEMGGSSALGVGKIINGEIAYYKHNNEKLFTYAPIAVDKNNAKWVAVFAGLIKISD